MLVMLISLNEVPNVHWQGCNRLLFQLSINLLIILRINHLVFEMSK